MIRYTIEMNDSVDQILRHKANDSITWLRLMLTRAINEQLTLETRPPITISSISCSCELLADDE